MLCTPALYFTIFVVLKLLGIFTFRGASLQVWVPRAAPERGCRATAAGYEGDAKELYDTHLDLYDE